MLPVWSDWSSCIILWDILRIQKYTRSRHTVQYVPVGFPLVMWSLPNLSFHIVGPWPIWTSIFLVCGMLVPRYCTVPFRPQVQSRVTSAYLLSLNVILILMFCHLQWDCYVCHALGCHFYTISTSKQPYFMDQIVIIYEPWTCHELVNFRHRSCQLTNPWT